MGFYLDTTGGTRTCRPCGKKIPKGSMVLVESFGGQYPKYDNFCPQCGVKTLKHVIKELISDLNDLNKYLQWDK